MRFWLFERADIGTRRKETAEGRGGEGEGVSSLSPPLSPFFRSRPNFRAFKQRKMHTTPRKRFLHRLANSLWVYIRDGLLFLCLKLKGDGVTFGGVYFCNFLVFSDFSGPVKAFVNS